MADLLEPFINLRTFMHANRIPDSIAVKVCPQHIYELKRQLLGSGTLLYRDESEMLQASILGFDIVEVRSRGACMLCIGRL